jgi:thiamine-phosphate pyrophosphorylase
MRLALPAAMALVTGVDQGRRAAAAGATVLQLRDPSAMVRDLEQAALQLVAASPVPVVVSSRVDVALAVGAAGVHLPERDLPVEGARRLLPDLLVGRSVHTLGDALQAEGQGADYVVFGPVFATRSHPGRPGVGLEALREVASALRIPVVAIGGIDADRIELCRSAGAAGFAAIRHFA